MSTNSRLGPTTRNGGDGDIRPAPLTRASTLPLEIPSSSSPRAGRSHLSPEDAFKATLPPRRPSEFETHGNAIHDTSASASAGAGAGANAELRRRSTRPKIESRSRSRRRKRSWKKLLWVNQSYPDNYTDQATFLENLQRNPRLQPYEFWPLVADSTVILQQVCSVTIFVTCFVGIFQERVSPVSVVGWGSFATFIGWLIWDWWVGQEEEDEVLRRQNSNRSRAARERESRKDRLNSAAGIGVAGIGIAGIGAHYSAASSVSNLNLAIPSEQRSQSHGNLLDLRQSHSTSAVSLQSAVSTSQQQQQRSPADSAEELKHRPSAPLHSGRTSMRLSTVKSAILIYFTLLGLSPILKSLTRSTSSDSIWAMSFWLLAINIFFYDYSGGVGVKFPASLSTNAALMASTVLASRLPSTGQVFSLTLFSIEVFGLFPVFRRYARHRSFRYHVALSVLLVVGAGLGMGLILGGEKDGGEWPSWGSGLLGILVAMVLSIIAMGGCSWWLISLQKYKNAINGPWDLARPIIISRRMWEEG